MANRFPCETRRLSSNILAAFLLSVQCNDALTEQHWCTSKALTSFGLMYTADLWRTEHSLIADGQMEESSRTCILLCLSTLHRLKSPWTLVNSDQILFINSPSGIDSRTTTFFMFEPAEKRRKPQRSEIVVICSFISFYQFQKCNYLKQQSLFIGKYVVLAYSYVLLLTVTNNFLKSSKRLLLSIGKPFY